MKKTQESREELLNEAIAYAIDIIEGFGGLEGTQKPPQIAVVLDALADEYHAARSGNRGMDPALVRILVQHVIDVVTFPKDNEPEIYDPDQPGDTLQFEAPLFRYARKGRGRPENSDSVVRVAYTVAAVVARFDLRIYRNDEPSERTSNLRAKSASDVVAKAHAKLGLQPSSYNGVRDCLERCDLSKLAWVDGEVQGKVDKKIANKMATTKDT